MSMETFYGNWTNKTHISYINIDINCFPVEYYYVKIRSQQYHLKEMNSRATTIWGTVHFEYFLYKTKLLSDYVICQLHDGCFNVNWIDEICNANSVYLYVYPLLINLFPSKPLRGNMQFAVYNILLFIYLSLPPLSPLVAAECISMSTWIKLSVLILNKHW